MYDKTWTFFFATKTTGNQALIYNSWFPGKTDTVLVMGEYLEFLGPWRGNPSSRSIFSLCNEEDGYIWDIDVEDEDEEGGDFDANLIDTIVTVDTEGIFGKIVN